ncbi:hypothetical protein NKR23_g4098 [Pleurostoma richardsiae]|uniref:Yeast cell wall synthesis Kre9/Knh1-like N-terminal domain-containing protein n=1 Tax=Pleurostoma richardsiae TaxID=41990 RepID=A0AA38S357_9PEZI|nr:hypothetical protein NKR23_g4098 [Pleurostoma richardsiae]
MHFPLLPLLLAVPLVAGIEFTSPAGGDSFVQGGEVTVEWTSVDTDPTIFSLYLWNFANFPPFYEPLVFDIDTVDGLTTVTLPCDVVASGGYQFSAINGTNVYVIYAQTGIFTITEGSCVAPTGTTSSPGVVTVTVTAELTCTSSVFYQHASTAVSS